ncbi:5-oxoprolinase subunit B family protein [Demequina globuliformis]|uniref:5-oxoprolinase subunit B family protein n=1 Tax=Demequina globuliformis TaxID=676202 RepID=UPI00078561C5|nr:carboxyltransferase domain-containing protein [Demequina globuliformis]
MTTRVLPLGAHAVVIEVDDPRQVADLAARLRAAREEGELACEEVVPAARTVMVSGLSAVDLSQLMQDAPAWDLAHTDPEPGPLVEIPVTFDGPDLSAVAAQWAVSVPHVIDTVIATEFTAAFSGFAPGFAYLTGLPESRTVARRPQPRPSVPAGALALAGPYAGVYPRSSPGGWQIIGVAREAVLWDPARRPPALLEPGARVRFVQ